MDKKKTGARILSEFNDLKRTVESAAKELYYNLNLLQNIVNGDAEENEILSLIRIMNVNYPINAYDLIILEDDCTDGIKIMKAKESKASSRIFDRKDKDGNLTPYYEYRDTCMSRLSPFKPEWIKVLRVVKDDDPNNPDVAFNNGHFMHQYTYFIGDVNFYYIEFGKKKCRTMKNGDSCYITPFTPHSFATKSEGLIIAVTYGGAVRRAQRELYIIGSRILDNITLDKRKKVLTDTDVSPLPHEHIYVYNYSDKEQKFGSTVLAPEDSAYVQPFKNIKFSDDLLVVGVEGEITKEVIDELERFQDRRMFYETKKWF